jgi:asparagine synthase (glutamine-hydrolysing)
VAEDAARPWPRDREDLVEQALRTAVHRRMVADVPVGVLLSGGVDSSLIVALLAEAGQTGLQTFSIGFDAAGGEARRRVQVLRPGRPRVSAPATTASTSRRQLMDAAARHHQAMSRADGELRQRRLSTCCRARSPSTRQGGAKRPGRRRGLRRLPLVPEAGRQSPPTPWPPTRRVFFDRTPRTYLRRLARPTPWPGASQALWRRHFDRAEARSTRLEKALHLDTTVMLVDDPVKRVDA